MVVVGGGFAGAAVAYHLLREMDGAGRIHLVEMGPWLGRGIAYGVESEVFRLNVPASRMSMDPEAPDDFVTFSGSEAAPHAFLGRALYARYVTARVAATVKTAPRRCGCGATRRSRITRDAVVLRGGATLPADVVILATGIVPRVKHAHHRFHPRVVDAWDECALATLPLGRKGGCSCSARASPRWTCSRSWTRRDSRARSPSSRRAGSCRCRTSPSSRGRRRCRPTTSQRAPTALRPLVRWVRETIASAVARRDALAARGRQSAPARHPPLPVTAGGAIAAASSATFDLTGTCFATAPRRMLWRASATGRATAACDGSPAA